MAARILRTIVAVSVCFSYGVALAGERPRHAPGLKQNSQALAADRDPYADPASPYKADRLSPRVEPILNIPGQTTVLTREVLDDMNATSLRDALRSTAGVTVGR
jgi:outer membrane receptor for monomeric catechols